MAEPVTRDALRAEILRLTALRGPEKSICPSEVARALAPEDWRRHMTAVRAAAAELSAAGAVQILRKGKPIAPEAMHGVIRLRQPPTETTP
ncbi:MAG: DUF3253 domain-containing protein [Rubritepida sp.]|nr:DUF3253 domain-containing protein [Rubritepida sp.]